MDLGDALTRWTVRVALALYAAALVLRLRAAGRLTWQEWARLAWTGGFLVFLFHMICAFHFFHGWSHDEAYTATARQTAEVVGPDWGGGLYANYAFALIWAVDAGWWWYRPQRYRTRSWAVEAMVQGFLAFLWVNATVVFGSGLIRWLGLVAGLGMVCMSMAALNRRNQ